MELLKSLEKKIGELVGLLKAMQSENAVLSRENGELKDQIVQLQISLLEREESLKEWDAQKASASQVVDSLIHDINSLMKKNESQK